MIGDADDIKARIYSALPTGWMADSNPILDAVIAGVAQVLAFVYGLLVYVKLQMRRQTATGGWLDLFAADFLGTGLPRQVNESDDDYRSRIKAALFQPMGTRQGVSDALQVLTGTTPEIIEFTRPADTLAYGLAEFGYSETGFYGSLVAHHQAIVIATYDGDVANVYAAINGTKVFGTIAWAGVV